MYHYYYRFLCVESEPPRLGVEEWLCFEIICDSCEIVCVIVVKKICERNQFVSGLKLGKDFGRDIRKTGKTLLENNLMPSKTKSENNQIKESISRLVK